MDKPGKTGRGPFRADQLRDGDRYELSNGHAVYTAPSGGRHGRSHVTGALPVVTDPRVTQAGMDVGYALSSDTMRAPDVSVGNVPDAPGWVQGVPPLAIEYANVGTDESDLVQKITELL